MMWVVIVVMTFAGEKVPVVFVMMCGVAMNSMVVMLFTRMVRIRRRRHAYGGDHKKNSKLFHEVTPFRRILPRYTCRNRTQKLSSWQLAAQISL